MLKIYQEFLAVNEEMAAFDPSDRLRWAVHEIMMRLKDGATIKFTEMSKVLKSDFKIDISEGILKDIFDAWDKYNDPDYSFFKKEDKNWMDAFCYLGHVKRKCRNKQSFGKHRKKEVTYSSDNSYGYWASNKWIPYNTGISRTGKESSTLNDLDDDILTNPYGNGVY